MFMAPNLEIGLRWDILRNRLTCFSRGEELVMGHPVDSPDTKEITLARCVEERKKLEKKFAELTAELERVRREWHYWQGQAETCGEPHDKYH